MEQNKCMLRSTDSQIRTFQIIGENVRFFSTMVCWERQICASLCIRMRVNAYLAEEEIFLCLYTLIYLKVSCHNRINWSPRVSVATSKWRQLQISLFPRYFSGVLTIKTKTHAVNSTIIRFEHSFFCCACGCAPGEWKRRQWWPPAQRGAESSAARITERNQELRPPSATEVSANFIARTQTKHKYLRWEKKHGWSMEGF